MQAYLESNLRTKQNLVLHKENLTAELLVNIASKKSEKEGEIRFDKGSLKWLTDGPSRHYLIEFSSGRIIKMSKNNHG
ncbi:hypothetical protein [Lactococcus termiticola]|uniref:hypothetical protein n=1 Tax=Lactococcus termiticola TaxID=2169526 RepID=UPI000D648FA0